MNFRDCICIFCVASVGAACIKKGSISDFQRVAHTPFAQNLTSFSTGSTAVILSTFNPNPYVFKYAPAMKVLVDSKESKRNFAVDCFKDRKAQLKLKT